MKNQDNDTNKIKITSDALFLQDFFALISILGYK